MASATKTDRLYWLLSFQLLWVSSLSSKISVTGGRCHQLAKRVSLSQVGMFSIGECIFCYKGPRKYYVSMTSNEASVFHSDERYMGESDRKENRMRSIENHCVRHSAGSYPSGEISQTDVHSHTRSNKGHRMYCFGELRTHHTSILASTSSYRQPCFAPHSVRKGHLENTHTHIDANGETNIHAHAHQTERGRNVRAYRTKGLQSYF